jgi:hypothetical protein
VIFAAIRLFSSGEYSADSQFRSELLSGRFFLPNYLAANNRGNRFAFQAPAIKWVVE